MNEMATFRAGCRPGRPATMVLRLFIIVQILWPCVVHANPVMIDGQSLLAFGIVAFWALTVESGLATFALFSSGILIVPSFITLVLANVALFLFAFMPLTDHVSLWVLEPGVVVADAVIIRALACVPFLQGGDFLGVSWRRCLVASLVGNVASFFIGVIGSRAPWNVNSLAE